MGCSLNRVVQLILLAIAFLAGAIAFAVFWPSAIPLFIAAGMVAAVSFGLIPAIKSALLAYATCRGPSANCSISSASAIDTLGEAATIISFVAFAIAGAMQIAALAFLFSWFFAWIGVAMSAVVATLVTSGITACAAGIIILLGVLTMAYVYKNCMDQQEAGSGGPAA